MNRLLTYIVVLGVLAGSPAWGANWLQEGTSNRTTKGLKAGERASYTFTATGQSPTIRFDDSCSTAQLILVATSATVQPYICSQDSTASGFVYTTNCGRLEATNLETGVFGQVEVTETDPFVIDIPYRLLLLDVTAGSGTVWVECRP